MRRLRLRSVYGRFRRLRVNIILGVFRRRILEVRFRPAQRDASCTTGVRAFTRWRVSRGISLPRTVTPASWADSRRRARDVFERGVIDPPIRQRYTVIENPPLQSAAVGFSEGPIHSASPLRPHPCRSRAAADRGAGRRADRARLRGAGERARSGRRGLADGLLFAATDRPAVGLNLPLGDLAGAGLHAPTSIPGELRAFIDTLADEVRTAVLDAPGSTVWMFFDARSKRCTIVPQPVTSEGIEAEFTTLVRLDNGWRAATRAAAALPSSRISRPRPRSAVRAAACAPGIRRPQARHRRR